MDGSDSDDNYGEEEKIILDELKERSGKKYVSQKNTVYGFGDDDSEEEEDASDVDMGSDIDDFEDHLPDDRAWGQRRKNFYNTDYIDKDFSGAYNAEEAEAAEMEEQEAKNIQKRLMEQLTDADFSIADLADMVVTPSESKALAIETDLSKLTKRQKLDLFRKESPEFENLVSDFEAKITEVRERIIPVLELIKKGKLSESPAGSFLETKYRLILNYCVNILFYILLKTKKIPVKEHPVLKALYRYRQLLNQLQPVDEEIIAPQVDKILSVFTNEGEEEEEKMIDRPKKKMLKILKRMAPKKSKKQEEVVPENIALDDGTGAVGEEEAEDDEGTSEEEQGGENTEKRAITYEMAKNKGLTPKRSKEQRNPRVKHRKKFRKAVIRRRGQVRNPRTEIPVYGGEPTGIKIGLKKGRKIM